MRRFLFTIIAIIMPASSSFCQVDTLMLIEINRLNIPGIINYLYTEDFDDDGIKEFIICTSDYIHIYDSQTNELIWTSPELINPEDLIFKDINNDGFVDFSVRDSLNIFLFDIINDQILSSSPTLDSTYCCYTIGDRNDDCHVDLVTVCRILTDNIANYDTIWINIYDGLIFQEQEPFFVLMERHSHWEPFDAYSINESPSKIAIEKITQYDQLHPFIFIFSNYGYSWTGPSMSGGGNSGNCWIFDGMSLDVTLLEDVGGWTYSDIVIYNDITYLYSVNSYSDYISMGGGNSIYKKYLNRYSWNSAGMHEIWYRDDYNDPGNWLGFVDGDIYIENNNIEICFAYGDNLCLRTIPNTIHMWTTSEIAGLSSVNHIYRSQNLFDNPQVMCKVTQPENHYQFYSGADGSLAAILLSDYTFFSVTDLNNDANDELLTIQNDYVFTYYLDYYVDIDNQSVLPYSTYIKSNYPNPFNNSTTIEYGLKQDEHVTIEIYNILGRKAQTLYDGRQTPGEHSLTWQADGFASGVYFYKIQAENYIGIKKMVLLK